MTAITSVCFIVLLWFQLLLFCSSTVKHTASINMKHPENFHLFQPGKSEKTYLRAGSVHQIPNNSPITVSPISQNEAMSSPTSTFASNFIFTEQAKDLWISKVADVSSTTNINSMNVFCPLSSNPAVMSVDGHFHYPWDVFNYSTTGTNSKPVLDTDLIPCIEYDPISTSEDATLTKDILHEITHKCPKQALFCPIQRNTVLQAAEPMGVKWNKKYSFCDLKVTVAENKPINVYVFGNSITSGIGTQGCKNPDMGGYWGPYDKDWKKKGYGCAWPHYFGHWIQSLHKSTTTTINFAAPGIPAAAVLQKFNNLISTNKTPKFTNRDFVFIDTAKTDVVFLSPHYNEKTGVIDSTPLETVYRLLIKKIYEHSESNHIPTIILIEIDEENSVKTQKMTEIYTKIATEHRLHFISYRNAVYSGYTSDHHTYGNTNYLPYIEYLKWNTTIGRHNWHPGWFVHLYMGDLVAAVFVRELALCDVNSGDSSSGSSKKNDMTSNNIDNNDNGVKTSIIHGSSNSSTATPIDLLSCDDSVAPLLRISYDAITQNETITGSYATPHDHWQLTTDLKGRGGFIRTIKHSDVYSTHDNATIQFMFNVRENIAWNSAQQRHRLLSGSGSSGSSAHSKAHLKAPGSTHNTISATANLSVPSSKASTSSGSTIKFMLSLTYLASYVHVGVVDVYICNQYMTTIDALWNSHHSIPQTKNIVFDNSLCIAGHGASSGGASGSGGSGSSGVLDANYYTVEIKHRIQLNNSTSQSVGDTGISSDLSELVRTAPRFKQMFKISSVDVCQVIV